MAGKVTQRHPGPSTPAAHHRVSLEYDTDSPKKLSRWIIPISASLLCLVVAGMYVWSTHDLIGFLILYGIATGAISVREVIGASPIKRLSGSVERKQEGQDFDAKSSH